MTSIVLLRKSYAVPIHFRLLILVGITMIALITHSSTIFSRGKHKAVRFAEAFRPQHQSKAPTSQFLFPSSIQRQGKNVESYHSFQQYGAFSASLGFFTSEARPTRLSSFSSTSSLLLLLVSCGDWKFNMFLGAFRSRFSMLPSFAISSPFSPLLLCWKIISAWWRRRSPESGSREGSSAVAAAESGSAMFLLSWNCFAKLCVVPFSWCICQCNVDLSLFFKMISWQRYKLSSVTDAGNFAFH